MVWLLLVAIGTMLTLRSMRDRLSDLSTPSAQLPASTTVDLKVDPFPAGPVRQVEIDGTGVAWLRGGDVGASGELDRVTLMRAGSRIAQYLSLREAVAASESAARTSFGLIGFWEVDDQQNIWVGGARLEGPSWTEVLEDWSTSESEMDYGSIALRARDGSMWVDFRSSTACPGMASCTVTGVEGVLRDGTSREIRLTEGQASAGGPSVSVRMIGERGGSGEAWAVGPRFAIDLATQRVVTYPGLRDSRTGGVKPGYVSAAAAVGGKLSVVESVEESSAGATQRIVSLTTLGTPASSIALSGGPLRGDGLLEITAMDFAGAGPSAWLGTSDGQIGVVTRQGEWTSHFSPLNSPLGSAIFDLDVADDGSVWVASMDGVRLFAEGVWTGTAIVTISLSPDGVLSTTSVVVDPAQVITLAFSNRASMSRALEVHLDSGVLSSPATPPGTTSYLRLSCPGRPGSYGYQVVGAGGDTGAAGTIQVRGSALNTLFLPIAYEGKFLSPSDPP